MGSDFFAAMDCCDERYSGTTARWPAAGWLEGIIVCSSEGGEVEVNWVGRMRSLPRSNLSMMDRLNSRSLRMIEGDEECCLRDEVCK